MNSLTRAARSRLKSLSGKWRIVEMPDLAKDYLSMSKDPHFDIAFKGGRVDGHYQYGLCNGSLDGEVVRGGHDGAGLEIRFSFEGMDEMDEESGYGEGVFSDDDRTLTGKLHYHMSDD